MPDLRRCFQLSLHSGAGAGGALWLQHEAFSWWWLLVSRGTRAGGLQWFQHTGSVVVCHWLPSVWNLPNQGLNPALADSLNHLTPQEVLAM